MSEIRSSKRKRLSDAPVTSTIKKARAAPLTGAAATARAVARNTTPRTSSQQTSSTHPSPSSIITEERIISLRSKDISTPVQRVVYGSRQPSEASDAADSDGEDWEGMDVEGSSSSESESPAPVKRLYLDRGGRGSIGTSRRRSAGAASAEAPAMSNERASSSAARRSSRRGVDDDASQSDQSQTASVASARRRRSSQVAERVDTADASAIPAGLRSSASARSSAASSSSSAAYGAQGGSERRAGSVRSVASASSASVTAGPSSVRQRAPAPVPLLPHPASAPAVASAMPAPSTVPTSDGANDTTVAAVVPPAQDEAADADAATFLDRLRAAVLAFLPLLVIVVVVAVFAYMGAHIADPSGPSQVQPNKGTPHLEPRAPVPPQFHAPSHSDSASTTAMLLQQIQLDLEAQRRDVAVAAAEARALHGRFAEVNATAAEVVLRDRAAQEETLLQMREVAQHTRDIQRVVGAAGDELLVRAAEAHAELRRLDPALGAAGEPATVPAAALQELSVNATLIKTEAALLVKEYAATLEHLAQRTALLANSSAGAQAALDQLSVSEGAELAERASATELLHARLLHARERVSSYAQSVEEVDAALQAGVQSLRQELNVTAQYVADRWTLQESSAEQYTADQREASAAAVKAAEEAEAEFAAAAAAAVVLPAPVITIPSPVQPQPKRSVQTSVDQHLNDEESNAALRAAAVEALRPEVEKLREAAEEEFGGRAAAKVDRFQETFSSEVHGKFQGATDIDKLLHKTGYSRSNRGLEAVEQSAEEDLGEEATRWEDEGEGVEDVEAVRMGHTGPMLAAMHDFAIGVRGGKVVHHRVLCPAEGGLRLTTPGRDAQSGNAMAALTSTLLAPLKDVLGALSPSSARAARGSRMSDSARGQSTAASASLATLVSHARPVRDSYVALVHSSDAARRSERAEARRSTRGSGDAVSYAASVADSLAQVTVTMLVPVIVSVVKVIHATAGDDSEGALPACAPEAVRVWGWTEDPAKVRRIGGRAVALGEFELDAPMLSDSYGPAPAGSTARVWEQALLVAAPGGQPLRAVTLQVVRTRGQADISCLHRLQVIGGMAPIV